MISRYFDETLSIYCGGIDNLYRHHDYTLAVLESVRPYPMARYWLHCNHLYVDGRKMSKSKGNILYTDDLKKQGHDWSAIRFFLIYKHYRERINYSDEHIRRAADRLLDLRNTVREIERASKGKPSDGSRTRVKKISGLLKRIFVKHMDNDLNVKDAFDELCRAVNKIKADELATVEASEILESLRGIDEVLRVIF